MNRLPFIHYPIQDLQNEIRQVSKRAKIPFFNLFSAMWVNDGMLPYQERILSSIAEVPLRWWRQQIAPELMDHFIIINQGANLTHERLWHEWQRGLRTSVLQSGRITQRWTRPNSLKSLNGGYTAVIPVRVDKKERKKEGYQEEGLKRLQISDELLSKIRNGRTQ